MTVTACGLIYCVVALWEVFCLLCWYGAVVSLLDRQNLNFQSNQTIKWKNFGCDREIHCFMNSYGTISIFACRKLLPVGVRVVMCDGDYDKAKELVFNLFMIIAKFIPTSFTDY